jgi:hypothetical protein
MTKFNFNSLSGLTLSRNPVEVCADLLRRKLPVFSHPDIDDALRGDVEAAIGLSLTDNHLRPLVLLCLYSVCRDSAGFKAAFTDIWAHDGHLVFRAIGAPLLSDMFMVAGVRPERQGSVTVYRGGQGVIDVLRRGWSWTTQRSVAAWFATRYSTIDEPLVVEATVKPSRIVHVCDERDEHEVVIPCGVRGAIVSGTLDEWMMEGAAWHASVTSNQAALLSQLASTTMPHDQNIND